MTRCRHGLQFSAVVMVRAHSSFWSLRRDDDPDSASRWPQVPCHQETLITELVNIFPPVRKLDRHSKQPKSSIPTQLEQAYLGTVHLLDMTLSDQTKVAGNAGEPTAAERIWRGPAPINNDNLIKSWRSLGHYFFNKFDQFSDIVIFVSSCLELRLIWPKPQ